MLKNKKNEINKYNLLVAEGIKLANQLKYSEAETTFLNAIKINKKEHHAYLNLSNIYILQNKEEKCIDLLFTYLLKYELNKNILNYAGKIFYNYKYNKELLKLFEIFKLNEKFNKDAYYIFYIKGMYHERAGEFEKAKHSYYKSISCNKNFYQSYLKLLSLLEKTNDILNLKLLINSGLTNIKDNNKRHIFLFYKAISFSKEKKIKLSQRIIKENNLRNKLSKNINLSIKLLDIETKNLELLKDYSKSFKKAKEKNNILLSMDAYKKYNGKIIFDSINKYKKFYTKKNISSITKNLNYHDDKKLVFLIGFPRSGTTLLDSILRTHTKIKVLEEKPFILNLRHDYFRENNNDLSSLLHITQKEKDKIRLKYYDEIIKSKEDQNKIIVDKFPLSIIELGFIKCIFPNSRIILSMRHPCDVVTSCFFSTFKINDAMINFLKWETTINFYNKVFDLFNFYQNEFDINLSIVKYEDIVYNFKESINNVIDFLDLKYEKKLEQFYVTAKKRTKISTPSYDQVVKPLYVSSIGRWKNYSKYVDLDKHLYKWIKKYNY